RLSSLLRAVLSVHAGRRHSPRTAIDLLEGAADTPLCRLTPDMQNRRIVNAYFKQAGVTVRTQIETNSVITLCAQLRSRPWSSILPQVGRPEVLRRFTR